MCLDTCHLAYSAEHGQLENLASPDNAMLHKNTNVATGFPVRMTLVPRSGHWVMQSPYGCQHVAGGKQCTANLCWEIANEQDQNLWHNRHQEQGL